MKRHIVRVLIAIVSFFIGVGITSLLSSDESTVKELPELIVYSPSSTPVFTATAPQPVLQVAAPATPVTEPLVVMDYNSKKFNPAGHYFLGKSAPKAFAELDGFTLEWWEADNKELQGDVSLYVTDAGQYYDPAPIRLAWVTRNRLVFATSATNANDFEYRFDGRFLRSGVVALAKPGTWVLEGTLTKLKNGQKVAEEIVKFQVEELHEC